MWREALYANPCLSAQFKAKQAASAAEAAACQSSQGQLQQLQASAKQAHDLGQRLGVAEAQNRSLEQQLINT
eukprot:scaffold196575_cov27-Tisochrysis_lutea.AAC.1